MTVLHERLRAAARRTRVSRRAGVTAGVAAAALGAATVVAPVVMAEETPQRALQAVTVRLAADGAVTSLTSALVSRDEDGGGGATRSTALDPAEHADDLPVRVVTTWRHGGRVGTDLAELDGVAGRVQIDLTVQNATVRPERFRYDVDGTPREAFELVAVPMTVVASASLPAGAEGSVVRPQPGTTEPGTTNGVISGDGDQATVQWASLLAPPRLAPTTTFSLVVDTEDFEVPEFTVAAQPGLATDTSVARLVDDVFSGSTALVGSENNTIGLIAEVNATLAEVTESLVGVQETLATNAGEVGEAATAALTRTADDVDAAAAAVLADLEALDGSVGATVESTNSRANSALSGAVDSIKAFFGDPDAAGAAPTTGTCGVTPRAEVRDTLLGQLAVVSSQLRQLADAGIDCVDDLRATLTNTIGTAQACTNPKSQALVCRLLGATDELVALSGKVLSQQTKVDTELGVVRLPELRAELDELVTAVQALQADGVELSELLEPGTTVEDLKDGLTTVGDGITDALAALEAVAQEDAASVQAVRDELAAIQTVADDRITALTGTGGVQEQLAALASSVCALVDPVDPANDPDAVAASAARALVDGKDCAGNDLAPAGAAQPLTASIQADLAAWQSIAGPVAGARAALDQVGTGLDAVRDALQGLNGPLTSVRSLVNGPVSDRKLEEEVGELLARLDALHDPVPAGWDCRTDTPSTTAPPVTSVWESLQAVGCDQTAAAQALKQLFTAAAAEVDAAGAAPVKKAAEEAEGAGTGADTALGGLAGDLAQQLEAAATRQLEQGQAQVAAQNARLEAEEAAAARELDEAARDAIGSLAEQISAATTQQAAASAALQAQLQKVLLDLGSAADGTGLLGVMQNSAGQTGVRTEQVEQTSGQAASFRGVRVAELADARLEQQQFARSVQAAQTLDPFAVELPEGSVSMTVFSFRIGGEG